MNSILPTELQREILSCLSNSDKLEYARCNKSLCQELVAGFRIITVGERMRYLSSESFRNKILGLIVDPYKQLDLRFDDLRVPSLPGNSQFRTLRIVVGDLPGVLPHLTKVYHLELDWKYEVLTVDFINNRVSIPQVDGLRRLSFINYLKSSLTSLSDQLDLRSLRYLKLENCRSLSDVRCLDHIYELHLLYCSALVDISCLNHNQKIEIHSCAVVDYSQSFRFSRDITVIAAYRFLHGNISTIKGVNIVNLEAVHSLSVDYDKINCDPDPLSHTESLPSSLRYLSVKGVKSQVLISPYHRLKEISISKCYEVSLSNFNDIRVVRVEHCNAITDWTPLQGIASVEISCCNGFTSGKQLSNVKKLTLIHYTLNHMKDLGNITHLKLDKSTSVEAIDASPYIESSTRGKELFSSAIKLQEIELKINFFDSHISILHSIMKSPQHKRILIMSQDDIHSINEYTFEFFHQRIVKNFGKFYDVEVKHPKKIVLLKRDHIELSSSWSISSIFGYFMQR